MAYDFAGLSDEDFVTVSFRCPVKQARLVNDAAALKGMTVADYVRTIALDWAASDLGVEIPLHATTAQIAKEIDQAAAKAGLSRKAFLMQAAYEKLHGQLTKIASGEYFRADVPPTQIAAARAELRRRGVSR